MKVWTEQGTTYSLAFFFGPGFPRTFGGALGSTGAALLPGFFFTPSVGGGIDEDGVPTGAGVLFVSELFPSVVATFVCDVDAAGGDSFFIDESSLLIDVDCGRNFCRDVGGNLKVMILLGCEDFRRAAAAGDGFVVEDIVVRWMEDGCMVGGSCYEVEARMQRDKKLERLMMTSSARLRVVVRDGWCNYRDEW